LCRTTKPVRIVSSALRAASSVSVIGTVRRVRPFGEVITPRRVCLFTVIVPAIRSTSRRQSSARTSPIRRPASPARQHAAYHIGSSFCAAASSLAYSSRLRATISGRSTFSIPTDGALAMTLACAA
jgi:hypothetical protein